MDKNFWCMIFGHMKCDPNDYGRFDSTYHAIDGIGRHHRIIQYQCDRCGKWVKLCNIHTTFLEGDKKYA